METEEIQKDDLGLKDLGEYFGTEQYHNVMGTNVTDGVIYIMQNGYSWFVTDFLAVAKFNEKVKVEEFISVKLKIDGDKAKMVVTDGNDVILYEQKYVWTNAKVELTLFFTDKVLLLSGEY